MFQNVDGLVKLPKQGTGLSKTQKKLKTSFMDDPLVDDFYNFNKSNSDTVYMFRHAKTVRVYTK